MERFVLNDTNTQEAAEKAAEVLRAGGVVLYPTDTLYGLGADAFSDEAVAKVYAIKGRDEKKPIHAVAPDVAMIEKYADMNDAARKLAEKFLPGPLTLVLKKKEGVEGGIAHGIDTIGFRIPASDFCIALASSFGKPYTTTSANRAGGEVEQSLDAILAQIGEEGVDLTIDAGALGPKKPSTVLDIASGEPKVLREGAIAASEVLGSLGKEVV